MFFGAFAHFLPFLTAKFPEIFHTLGEGGLEGVEKINNFFF